MGSIVSTPDPGGFSRPLHNGHAEQLVDGDRGDLLVADLRAYEPPLALTAELVEQQTRIVEQDLAALLADEHSAEQPVQPNDPLPGFETLTRSDVRACPAWCVHQDLPVHGDAFDADPGSSPHRGVEHTLHTIHGGESIDQQGRCEVTVQLEQDRDLSTGPVVTLSVVVNGLEQYAWLTLPEAQALHHTLTHILSEADA